jgi:hypothetical protein
MMEYYTASVYSLWCSAARPRGNAATEMSRTQPEASAGGESGASSMLEQGQCCRKARRTGEQVAVR